MIGIRRYGSVNSCRAPITLMITTRMMAGRIIGSLIRVTIRLSFAPSTTADSTTSRGTDLSAVYRIMMVKPVHSQMAMSDDDPKQVARARRS